MKSWLFERINRIEKCLVKLTQIVKRPKSVRSEVTRKTTQHMQMKFTKSSGHILNPIFYQIRNFEINAFLNAYNITKLRQDDTIFKQ